MALLKRKSLSLLAAGLLASSPLWAEGGNDAEETSFSEALSAGKAAISFRYRYEFVDQQGFSKNANASTLRTRLNYRSGRWYGFSGFLEAENISHLIVDDFNAAAGNTPNKGMYPVVADPKGTEINQAYLDYNYADQGFLRLGRQRILLDNQRFVGGVGWRQNEQTFDGFSWNAEFANQAKLFAGYIWNVNRIFGNDVPSGDHRQDTLLLNFSLPVADAGKFVAYAYSIDNQDAAAFSTTTLGGKWSGKLASAGRFSYALEYAWQSDNANNPVDYTASYYRLDAGWRFDPVTIFAGFESLGGDRGKPGAAFRTPLATLHAFNGWADRFLVTPNAGLDDLFFGVKGKFGGKGHKWTVLYHDFSAEDGGGGFGSEIDASLVTPINKHFSLLFKAAFFNGEGGYPDTTKLWLMGSAKF